MKKLMIMLLMVVATSTASFAKGSNDNVQTAAKEVVQKVKDAPSGTTYGVVEVTKSHIVVNTPLGRYNINKNEDGSFSFMGMTAKLVAVKNGVYKVQTSFGRHAQGYCNKAVSRQSLHEATLLSVAMWALVF